MISNFLILVVMYYMKHEIIDSWLLFPNEGNDKIMGKSVLSLPKFQGFKFDYQNIALCDLTST